MGKPKITLETPLMKRSPTLGWLAFCALFAACSSQPEADLLPSPAPARNQDATGTTTSLPSHPGPATRDGPAAAPSQHSMVEDETVAVEAIYQSLRESMQNVGDLQGEDDTGAALTGSTHIESRTDRTLDHSCTVPEIGGGANIDARLEYRKTISTDRDRSVETTATVERRQFWSYADRRELGCRTIGMFELPDVDLRDRDGLSIETRQDVNFRRDRRFKRNQQDWQILTEGTANRHSLLRWKKAVADGGSTTTVFLYFQSGTDTSVNVSGGRSFQLDLNLAIGTPENSPITVMVDRVDGQRRPTAVSLSSGTVRVTRSGDGLLDLTFKDLRFTRDAANKRCRLIGGEVTAALYKSGSATPTRVYTLRANDREFALLNETTGDILREFELPACE